LKKLILCCLMLFLLLNGYKSDNYNSKLKSELTEVDSITKNSIGKTYSLQLGNARINWSEDGLQKIYHLSDEVLSTLKANKRASKDKTTKEDGIVLLLYPKCTIYIDSLAKNPESSIIIKTNNGCYLANGNKEKVKNIMEFLEYNGFK
jgi:hypothetical protein